MQIHYTYYLYSTKKIVRLEITLGKNFLIHIKPPCRLIPGNFEKMNHDYGDFISIFKYNTAGCSILSTINGSIRSITNSCCAIAYCCKYSACKCSC